jgi:DNA-binding CsgD family transcriptional regulator
VTARRRRTPREDASKAAAARPEIEAPRDLEAAILDVGGDEYLLLTFPTEGNDFSNLTESEREVATELLRGRSYKEIARIRGTKVGTVANQVRSLFRKLAIRSRSELARSGSTDPKGA